MSRARCRSPRHHPRRFGFSILELAVVLGVIGLIAGAGISMATGALKAADRVTTQERLNTIKIALDSYGKTYGYLPCPASRILTPTSPNFGIESRSGTVCTAIATGVVTNASMWFGALPVRTLGLPDNYAWDAWNGKLTYAVPSLMVSDPTRYSLVPTGLDVRAGTRTTSYPVTTRIVSSTPVGTASSNSGTLRLNMGSALGIPVNSMVQIQSTSYRGSHLATGVSGNTIDFAGTPFTVADTGVRVSWSIDGAGGAFAVISHGPDGLGAFPSNSSSIPAIKGCSATAIDGENCNDDATLFDVAYNDGAQAAALYFDDYIVWGSNQNFRFPIDTTLYTNNFVGPATSNCPAGTCEAWCAACVTNYPGGGTTAPPTTFTSATVLCRKVITSNASLCNASCFWGGLTVSGFLECP